MMKIPSTAALLALALLLVACGSTPASNYYLLTVQDTTIPDGDTPSLGIGPIMIPEYLNRAGMVSNHSQNKLQISKVDLWAEPLTDGMQRVLSLNLAGLLNTEDVQSYPWAHSRAPHYGVRLTVLELDANASEASLATEWSVLKPRDAQLLTRQFSRLVEPMPPGPASASSIAQAYSRLFHTLSTIIAAAISEDMRNDQSSADQDPQ